MKIYLAARYTRRQELLGYRDDLARELKAEVTSRWLNGNHQLSDAGTPIGDHGESLVEDGDTDEAARLREHFALEDLADVDAADLLISFTEPPRAAPSRGGRHVELGYALGRGMPSIVVGPRENVFSWLPQVTHFDTWQDCLERLVKFGMQSQGPRFRRHVMAETADSRHLLVDVERGLVIADLGYRPDRRISVAMEALHPLTPGHIDQWDEVPF